MYIFFLLVKDSFLKREEINTKKVLANQLCDHMIYMVYSFNWPNYGSVTSWVEKNYNYIYLAFATKFLENKLVKWPVESIPTSHKWESESWIPGTLSFDIKLTHSSKELDWWGGGVLLVLLVKDIPLQRDNPCLSQLIEIKHCLCVTVLGQIFKHTSKFVLVLGLLKLTGVGFYSIDRLELASHYINYWKHFWEFSCR